MTIFDCILFDVDGVLVDVSQSYRVAIKEAVRVYTNGRKKVSDEDIRKMKSVEGFNNDWDVSFALAFGREIALTKKEKASKEYFELKMIFQEFYLGSELFRKVYCREGSYGCRGLINDERLLIRTETLDALQSAGLRLGIVTSRPRLEALYALKPLIPRYFSEECIVAQEDCEEEKPSPKPLLQAASKMGGGLKVYVGDSYNDVIAALRAKMPCIYVGGNGYTTVNVGDVNELTTVLKLKGKRCEVEE